MIRSPRLQLTQPVRTLWRASLGLLLLCGFITWAGAVSRGANGLVTPFLADQVEQLVFAFDGVQQGVNGEGGVHDGGSCARHGRSVERGIVGRQRVKRGEQLDAQSDLFLRGEAQLKAVGDVARRAQLNEPLASAQRDALRWFSQAGGTLVLVGAGIALDLEPGADRPFLGRVLRDEDPVVDLEREFVAVLEHTESPHDARQLVVGTER